MCVLIGLAQTGAERVVTTGRASHDDRSVVHDDRSVVRDNGYAARDNKSAARVDGYGNLKKIGRRRVCNTRRRVQGRATTGHGRAHTAEIGRRQVSSGRRQVLLGRRRLRSRNDGSRIGQQWVRPRADVSRLQYIRGAN